jgi:uncharacterized membrane-anchored protein
MIKNSIYYYYYYYYLAQALLHSFFPAILVLFCSVQCFVFCICDDVFCLCPLNCIQLNLIATVIRDSCIFNVVLF